ncbi:MAG: hypothetical protein QM699_00195 [Amaricoccus sp.]|uniref:hypothetical protein n=1 Tax=Amaricoccus sp. TaxID=1872485 RepID=UPI0039E4F0C9
MPEVLGRKSWAEGCGVGASAIGVEGRGCGVEGCGELGRFGGLFVAAMAGAGCGAGAEGSGFGVSGCGVSVRSLSRSCLGGISLRGISFIRGVGGAFNTGSSDVEHLVLLHGLGRQDELRRMPQYARAVEDEPRDGQPDERGR